MKDTGGPAFPGLHPSKECRYADEGMTLRDWFAGKAMQGLLADALDDEFTQGRISNHTGRKAAAELRRLHSQRDQLLEALKEARWRIANLVGAEGAQGLDRKALDKIDAAIKAAEEGK